MIKQIKTFFSREPDMDKVLEGWYARLYRKGQDALAEKFKEGHRLIEKMPFETVNIRRGVRLEARLYMPAGEPRGAVLFCHGFHSFGEHDFAPAIPETVSRGWAALVIDQRTHGKSGGRFITYGLQERYDIAAWSRFLEKRGFSKIIIWGVSMGGASALMAAALPGTSDKTAGIIADCAYSSMKDEFRESMERNGRGRQYPALRLFCRVFGRFDPDKLDVAVFCKNIRFPVVFIHGKEDRLVTPAHSRRNFEACPTRKTLKLIEGAGHCLSFAAAPDEYLKTVFDFLDDNC